MATKTKKPARIWIQRLTAGLPTLTLITGYTLALNSEGLDALGYGLMALGIIFLLAAIFMVVFTIHIYQMLKHRESFDWLSLLLVGLSVATYCMIWVIEVNR